MPRDKLAVSIAQKYLDPERTLAPDGTRVGIETIFHPEDFSPRMNPGVVLHRCVDDMVKRIAGAYQRNSSIRLTVSISRAMYVSKAFEIVEQFLKDIERGVDVVVATQTTEYRVRALNADFKILEDEE